MRFETLIERYHDEIYGYLWRLVEGAVLSGGLADAEDLTQEVFLRAYQGFGRLKPASNHRAWLYKIATNCAYTAFKRSRRQAQQQAPLPDDEDAGPFSADSGLTPYQYVARREMLSYLQAALAGLPVKQQAALVMRHVQGLEYAEIAQALECSADSARANVYQALKRLRSEMNDEEAIEWRLP